jgi:hypothetical protein
MGMLDMLFFGIALAVKNYPRIICNVIHFFR